MCMSFVLNFLILFTLLCFAGQRDTTGLSAENPELKIRLQAMEQQAQLCDGESLTFSQQACVGWCLIVAA